MATVIICTGISGSGRKEYLDRFAKYALGLGKNVKVHHVGQQMIERAQRDGLNITPKNILNTNRHTMQALRSGVYESILRSFKEDHKKYDAIIISIHGFFYWKKTFHHSYDHHYIARFKPDLFITVMEDPVMVKETLARRDQWKRERLTENEIFLWQNVETEVKVEPVKEPNLDSYLVARNIADQLIRRMPYKRILGQAADKAMAAGAKGVRIVIAGRIGGAEIGRREKNIARRTELPRTDQTCRGSR
ncbi:MAG: AAA family ATPase [Patescibacteria group bacterium]